MKPTLFIASSTESLYLAEGAQANLGPKAYVTCWNQGFFQPGDITLNALLEKAAEFDFGVCVFSPQDVAKIREKESSVVRDNVLFEFGLFISKLGRDRVFMLRPKNSPNPMHLPSDLAGLTGATYDEEALKNQTAQAALGDACGMIATKMMQEWGKEANPLTKDLVLLLRYLGRDAGNWMPSDRYTQEIAISNGVTEQEQEQASPQLRKGWERAVRHGVMFLEREGLVQKNPNATAVLYSISKKGQRLLPTIEEKFPEVFKNKLLDKVVR